LIGLIAGGCFCCCRYYLDLCGGLEPNPDGYSNRQRNILKLLLFINSAFIIAMILLGIVGNSNFAGAINLFVNQLDTEAQKEKTVIESIQPRLDQVNYNRTELRAFVDLVTSGGASTIQNSETGKTYLSDNELYRLLILGFTYAFALLAIVMGVVSAIFSQGRISIATAFLCFWCIFMFWFNISIHFTGSVLMADLCYDIVEVTIEVRLQERIDSQGKDYGGIDSILHCIDWTNTQRTYEWADELIGDATNSSLLILQKSINGTATVNDTANYNKMQSDIMLLQGTELDILYVRDCRWLLPVFEPIQPQICGSQLSGIIIIWATSFVCSLLFIIQTVFQVMGLKRFPKSNSDTGFF